MKIIDNSTVVVFTSDELKNVLENDNGYSYIYFGSNIELVNGIKISSSKVNVVIDGEYEGVRHTFTDKKSLSSGDTITASYSTILSVTVCNMDIVGYNYYGMIYVPESSSYKNIVVEYNNIVYNGPQLSFHPVGLTRFINSDITISNGSLTTGNEVAECNKIEIGGITNIIHESKSNSAFWFRNANPSFVILSNAVVTFSSEYRELFYGVNNLTLSILNNSYFSVTSHSGMAYGSNGTGTTLIDSNAEFILKQTSSNGSYPTWQSYGIITLKENSSLSIINNYSGLSSSNYNISFSSSGGFIIDNPKRVVLYNEKANVINTSSSIPFNFNFSRVNLFDKVINIADNISLSTMPDYSWYKSSSNSSINGKFSSSSTSIENHNFTTDELKNLPSLDNFIFANKKIFSIGDFPFRVNALTDSDVMISGVTGAGNSILISYNDVNSVVVAGDDGTFNYSYDTPLEIGTIITFNVKMRNDVIYHTKVIQIVYSGELFIDNASSIINFKLDPISTNPIICPREGELVVKVTDSRVNSTDWKLYAKVNQELTSIAGDLFEGHLIYKDSNSNIYNLSSNPILVYTGKQNSGNMSTTNVSWNDNEGILLMIDGKIINGMEYTANIIWSIEE